MLGRRRRNRSPEHWASGTDIPEKGYEDVTLPNLRLKVRVRLLASHEVARLRRLPDLAAYYDLAQKFFAGTDEEKAEVDLEDIVDEEWRYSTYVSHVAVAQPTDEGFGQPVECEWCQFEDGRRIAHPPSLWTPKQTEKLHTTDQKFIAMVATGIQGGFAPLGSSSTDRTPSATPSSADTGG